jgi:hypothetical protein
MKKALLIVLVVYIAVTAGAQDSKKDDIKELMATVGMDELCHQLINSVFATMISDEEAQIPGLTDTLTIIMDEAINDLMDSVALIYDKVYTGDEIKQLIAFYDSPIGRRVIETMPLISELSLSAGRNWAAANTQIIQDRLAPLVGERKSREISYMDFYKPDEEFKEDNPGVIECSGKNNTKVKGSEPYEYYIRYNDNVWSVVASNTINPQADLTFMSRDQKVCAIVIAEASSITLQQLKAAAMYNLEKASDEVTYESIGLRKVNGREVLSIIITAEVGGETYKYYNYYYSGDWGVLQFIVFAYEADFEYNEVMIMEILSGLFVK